MTINRAPLRSLAGGVCLAVGVSLAGAVSTSPASSAPASASPASAAGPAATGAARGAGEHDVVVTAPSRMRLRSGCRQTYSLKASFDVSAGEDYWVLLRGRDSQGRTIQGHIVQETATSARRLNIKRRLQLCGSIHDAGVGILLVSVHVGDEIINARARTLIRYVDRVRMNKPKRVVKRGRRMILRGRWDRGRGFGLGCGYYNRKAVRVRIWFKPNGGAWRQVSVARINGYGAWRKSVKVTRSGRYQARVQKSPRYLPARSVIRRVRAR